MSNKQQFPSRPEHGQSWGPWSLDKNRLVLENKRWKYEIYLERINCSAEMLDWIFQISNKGAYSAEDVGHLVRAFGDIFLPQANLCSSGKDKPFDSPEYLKTLFG